MIIPVHCISDKNELVTLKSLEISFVPHAYDIDRIAKMLEEIFDIHNLAEEHVYTMAFDEDAKPIGIMVENGKENSVSVDYKEIAIYLRLTNAYKFVSAHNHPGGTTYPSRGDLEIVKDLMNLFPVELFDAIIVGGYGKNYVYSFRNEGFFEHEDDFVDWFHSCKETRLEDDIIGLINDKYDLMFKLENLEKILMENGLISVKKLTSLPNIGNKLAEALIMIGIYDEKILKENGSENVWLRLRDDTKFSNLNTLLSIEGAIRGTKKKDLSEEVISDLKEIYKKYK